MIRISHISSSLLFVSAILLSQTLFAEESIEDLLKTYRKEADLSKETKKENAGHLYVFTRDDLERMQVYRLSDLIKSMKFVRYNLNSFGMTDPLQRNPIFYSSDMIKVYINEHEISSGYSGSGLQFYGNIDMGMFDHVEIYYDSPVLDVATEPAAAVIKLYTKSPEREIGGDLQLRIGDRGMQEAEISHAKVFDTWSYFAYAEESENYFKHEHPAGTSVSKDYRQQHAFLDLRRENHRLELEYLGQNHDPFTAQSMMLTPTGGDWDSPMMRASYSGSWLENSLHTTASYIYSSIDLDMTSYYPFWGEILPPFNSHPHLPPSRFKLKAKGDLFTVKSYYEKMWEMHQLKVGAIYRYKSAKTTEYSFNDIDDSDRKAHFNIGSLFFQDQMHLSTNTMLSFSMKVDYYDFSRTYHQENDDDTMTTWQGRIAYSAIKNNWYFKTFLTHVEFPTQLYDLLMHGADLDSQKFNTLSFEGKYVGERDEIRLFVSGSQVIDFNDIASLDTGNNRIKKTDLNLINSSIDFTHHFSRNHRFDFDIYHTHVDKKIQNQNKNYVGLTLRLLDTFGDWDIFNELVFRQKTPEVDPGWDYNAGVKYRVTKDLTFALKGVNIFNDAKETRYYALDVTQLPNYVMDGKNLPVIERQVYFTLEWLF